MALCEILEHSYPIEICLVCHSSPSSCHRRWSLKCLIQNILLDLASLRHCVDMKCPSVHTNLTLLKNIHYIVKLISLSVVRFVKSFFFFFDVHRSKWVAVQRDATVTARTNPTRNLVSVEVSPIRRSVSTISDVRRPVSTSFHSASIWSPENSNNFPRKLLRRRVFAPTSTSWKHAAR